MSVMWLAGTASIVSFLQNPPPGPQSLPSLASPAQRREICESHPRRCPPSQSRHQPDPPPGVQSFPPPDHKVSGPSVCTQRGFLPAKGTFPTSPHRHAQTEPLLLDLIVSLAAVLGAQLASRQRLVLSKLLLPCRGRAFRLAICWLNLPLDCHGHHT
jgi:hypothetical protein